MITILAFICAAASSAFWLFGSPFADEPLPDWNAAMGWAIAAWLFLVKIGEGASK